MDPTARHRRSPSSDRFLDVFSFSPPPPSAGAFSLADEFNEDDVFFTNDFAEPDESRRRRSPPDRPRHQHHARRASFPHPGILDALPDADRRSPSLYRKPSTPAKSIPAIPRPPPSERDLTQSRKMQQSAPVKIPVLSRALMMSRDPAILDDEIEDEEEMLPPHEIVARGSARSPKTTYSVLEGAGRTLKGRDLRQVRNAIWRQTGFLD